MQEEKLLNRALEKPTQQEVMPRPALEMLMLVQETQMGSDHHNQLPPSPATLSVQVVLSTHAEVEQILVLESLMLHKVTLMLGLEKLMAVPEMRMLALEMLTPPLGMLALSRAVVQIAEHATPMRQPCCGRAQDLALDSPLLMASAAALCHGHWMRAQRYRVEAVDRPGQQPAEHCGESYLQSSLSAQT